MMNQVKLNFKITRWIWVLILVTIIVNATTVFFFETPLSWIINLLNIVTITYIFTTVSATHRQYEKNDSYRIYFMMPVAKKEVLNADYTTNIIMMLVSLIVFLSWAVVSSNLMLIYGMILLLGINLIGHSIYHITFVKQWFKRLSPKELYLIVLPLLGGFLLHFMPFKNILDRNLNIPRVLDLYFTQLPFIVLSIGIVLYMLSYYKSRKIVTETDIE